MKQTSEVYLMIATVDISAALQPLLRLAPELALPAEETVTAVIAVVGKRKSGKTYAAKRLVEELIPAGLPMVVIDPLGVWWGLRAAADGVAPGLPVVVLGGPHGDLPLTAAQGRAVAALLIEAPFPAVLDLAGLDRTEQATFVADFVDYLYQHNYTPLHIVVDESDLFAPQQPARDQQRALRAMDNLARRGRAKGLGLTVITQRIAVISKSVLSQLDLLIALRTVSPGDLKAIDGWLAVELSVEQRRGVRDSLPALPVGTAWVAAPGWLGLFGQVAIPPLTTFDSSATPKLGSPRRDIPLEPV